MCRPCPTQNGIVLNWHSPYLSGTCAQHRGPAFVGVPLVVFGVVFVLICLLGCHAALIEMRGSALGEASGRDDEGKARCKPAFAGYWRLSHPDCKSVPRGKVPKELPSPWWEEEETGDEYEF